jgi:hypothetical protein
MMRQFRDRRLERMGDAVLSIEEEPLKVEVWRRNMDGNGELHRLIEAPPHRPTDDASEKKMEAIPDIPQVHLK